MRIPRLYLNCELQSGQSITLDAAVYHRLSQVLRIASGDLLLLFNGKGGEHEAKVREVHKKKIVLTIGKWIARTAEPPLDIYLIQGISRGQKMDYTIQKAVELGAKKIYPLRAERSTVKLVTERAENRLAHWQSIVIHACEQSGRTELPALMPPQSLGSLIESLPPSLRFILLPQNGQKLNDISLAGPPDKPIVLLVGPEGGLSEDEVQYALNHAFIPLQLGPRTLRTETASIVVMSLLQYRWGDL